MPNQLNLSQAVEPTKPQTGLETKLNQNQEINELVAKIQGKQDVDPKNWEALSRLIPSGRPKDSLAPPPVKVVIPVPPPTNLIPSAYSTQKEFDLRKLLTSDELNRIGVYPEKSRVYVIDDFEKNVEVNNVYVSHGDLVKGVINQVTKGQAEIVSVPATSPGLPLENVRLLNQAIGSVITSECKHQGKTPDTVDLRNIVVNLSLGFSGENPPKETVRAINALTARGASVVISMGNTYLNSLRVGTNGVVFADGAFDGVVDPVNPNPVRTNLYTNGLAGKIPRTAESFQPSSKTLIGPSIGKTRLDSSGNLEIAGLKKDAPWSKLIDQKHTEPISTVIQSQGPLHEKEAGKHVSYSELKNFREWVEQAANEMKANGTGSEFLLRFKVGAESQIRFGKNAVISQTTLMNAAEPNNDVMKVLILNQTPDGQDPKKIVFSVEGAVVGDLRPYLKSDNGKLKTLMPNIQIITGTSFAAPVVSGFEAVRKQKLLNLTDDGKPDINFR